MAFVQHTAVLEDIFIYIPLHLCSTGIRGRQHHGCQRDTDFPAAAGTLDSGRNLFPVVVRIAPMDGERPLNITFLHLQHPVEISRDRVLFFVRKKQSWLSFRYLCSYASMRKR